VTAGREIQKTSEERVEDFKRATAQLKRLTLERQIAALERAMAALHLQDAGWSLQRIADAVGLSKNAVVKAVNVDPSHLEVEEDIMTSEHRRFLVQHLDMSQEAGRNGGNWTRYYSSLDEALVGADGVYDSANGLVRQEIVEVLDDGTTIEWRFRGGGSREWSPPVRRSERNLAQIFKDERVS
jgi:hypothetical protein